MAFGVYKLSRRINEDSSLWPVVEAQLNLMLPLAQAVFMEVLLDFLPNIPFELDLNDMLQYAGRQYFGRVSALEKRSV